MEAWNSQLNNWREEEDWKRKRVGVQATGEAISEEEEEAKKNVECRMTVVDLQRRRGTPELGRPFVGCGGLAVVDGVVEIWRRFCLCGMSNT